MTEDSSFHAPDDIILKPKDPKVKRRLSTTNAVMLMKKKTLKIKNSKKISNASLKSTIKDI